MKPRTAHGKTVPARRFDVDCQLAYSLPADTDFLFQVHALDGVDQAVLSESLTLTPATPHHVYADPTVGHRFLRVRAAAGALSLHYVAQVEVRRAVPDMSATEWAIHQLPDEVLHNLMATRYCESDLLMPAALKLFGMLPPGAQRVQAICDWVHNNVDYIPGSTDATTTACDVFMKRRGVCRDFAHLVVAFCRALNIPARLAVGYARFETPPPDFHAIVEAFVGGHWMLFDPTRLSPPGDLVRIAVGRDAKDVAFATIFGAASTQLIAPNVQPSVKAG